MTTQTHIRWKWLKCMYAITIIGPGIWGFGTVFFPDLVNSLFKFPDQHHFLYGITGSMWMTFSVLSLFGIRNPLKFLPVLMFQLTYKVIWISCVVLPLLIKGQLSVYEVVFALSMAAFVVGDLIAIPFSYLFKNDHNQAVNAFDSFAVPGR